MKSPDKGQLIIYSDASKEAWGGILCEEKPNGNLLICRYASGRFDDVETRYHIIQQELLAAKKSIKAFRLFVIGTTFILRSDLKHFERFLEDRSISKFGNTRLIRWFN